MKERTIIGKKVIEAMGLMEDSIHFDILRVVKSVFRKLDIRS